MTVANKNNYIDNYKREHYDRFNLLMEKGNKSKLQAIAKAEGTTVNALLNTAIDEIISRHELRPEPSGEIPEDAEQGTAAPTEPQTGTEPEN